MGNRAAASVAMDPEELLRVLEADETGVLVEVGWDSSTDSKPVLDGLVCAGGVITDSSSSPRLEIEKKAKVM